MRKLKIALVMLFAATLSLFLFACQKKEKAQIESITASGALTLTDADNEKAALEKLQQLTFTASYDSSKVEDRVIPSGEYTVSWAGVTFGQVGSYTASVTTDKDNQYAVAADVAVTIGHNFGVADDEGVQTCSVCNAVQIEQAITDTFKIEGWNDGVVLGAENKYIKSDPRLLNDDGNPITSIVGRLDKGMTIKLIGKGKALSTANTYYYPILGVANIEENGSVIQRNDNWSIYGAMGGKLNAWAGKPFSDIDAISGWVGAETAEEKRVYVDGPVSEANDYYVNDGADYVAVELTWSYSEDGVITMTWYNPTLDGTGRTRTATIKMPDRQYYNAILHGEQFEFVAEKIQIVQTLKLKSVDKIAVNANSVIENKYLDYKNMDVDITYEGDKKAKADAGVMEVYASKELKTELPADNVAQGGRTYDGWIDLATTKMSTEFKSYKLRVQIGNDWIEKIVPAAEAAKITVVVNAVDHANSNVVTVGDVKFEDTGLNAIAFTETADHKAGLTVSGKVATLTAAQKSALGTEKTHYLAFSVYANGVTKFGGTATVEGTEGKVNVSENKLDVVLAVKADTQTATIKGVNGGTDIVVTIEDLIGAAVTSTLSANTLKLDESKDITVTYQLDNIDDIVSNYSFMVNNKEVYFEATNSDTAYGFMEPEAGGLTLKSATLDKTAKTLAITVTVPAADLANPANYNVCLIGNGGMMLVTDNIRYEMAFTENATKAGEYYAKVSGTTLYLAKAFATTDAQAEALKADLKVMVNAGADTPEKNLRSEYIQNQDLAYTIGADGAVVFSSSSLLYGLASGKLAVFGTLNNNADTDYGALLVVAIDLSKIGIAENTAFAFAVDSTTENLYYKPVSAQGEIGADVTYTLPEKTTIRPASNCADTTDVGYAITSGDKVVFYAFSTAESSGLSHDWEEKTEGVVYECKLCHAVRTLRPLTENKHTETVILAPTAVENTDDSGDWWGDKALLNGSKKTLSGMFAVEYTWKNTRDANWYQDVVIELTDGAKFFDMNMFMGGGKWGELWVASKADDAEKTNVQTTVAMKNGEVLTEDQATAEFKQDAEAAGKWEGDYSVTIYRIGTTLTIAQKVVSKDGAVYEKIDTFTGFTTADLTAQLTGNCYWVDDIKVGVGTAGEYDTTVASYDNPTAFQTWHDIPTALTLGTKITVEGSMKQKTDATNYYNTVLFEFKEGFTGRLDNWGWAFGGAAIGSGEPTAGAQGAPMYVDGVANAEPWTDYATIVKDCKFVMEFEWSNSAYVDATITLSNAEKTFTIAYRLVINDASVKAFNLHLTGDAIANFTINSAGIEGLL